MVVIGGYTPYAVYDPRPFQDKSRQFDRLRHHREEIRLEIMKIMGLIEEPVEPEKVIEAEAQRTIMRRMGLFIRRATRALNEARLARTTAKLAKIDRQVQDLRVEVAVLYKELRVLARHRRDENESIALLLIGS